MEKNKTVGIITIHFVYNYGAMLQAYALNRYINEIGYKCEVIDYRPEYLDRDYRLYLKDIFHPRKFLFHILQFIKNRNKYTEFEVFLKNQIVKSETRYYKYNQLITGNYDLLISGSDQIWNPNIINNDHAYLLSFCDKNCLKMAYSSSFGVDVISETWEKQLIKNLKSFSFIGLREDKGIEILKNILPDKHYTKVLDPVFLISNDEWRKLAKPLEYVDYKFLLVYSLEPNNEMIEKAVHLAKHNNLKIVAIHPIKSCFHFADVTISDIGPKQFLWLLNKAHIVISNSYHGIAFSILFDKSFVPFYHSQTSSRAKSLLNHIFSEDELLSETITLSEEAKMKLDKLIKESKGFLEKSLNKI
jgi:hypothetical protein